MLLYFLVGCDHRRLLHNAPEQRSLSRRTARRCSRHRHEQYRQTRTRTEMTQKMMQRTSLTDGGSPVNVARRQAVSRQRQALPQALIYPNEALIYPNEALIYPNEALTILMKHRHRQ
jgi:hypothetical protein